MSTANAGITVQTPSQNDTRPREKRRAHTHASTHIQIIQSSRVSPRASYCRGSADSIIHHGKIYFSNRSKCITFHRVADRDIHVVRGSPSSSSRKSASLLRMVFTPKRRRSPSVTAASSWGAAWASSAGSRGPCAAIRSVATAMGDGGADFLAGPPSVPEPARAINQAARLSIASADSVERSEASSAAVTRAMRVPRTVARAFTVEPKGAVRGQPSHASCTFTVGSSPE